MTDRPTPFLVFATQRTGSSWVTSTLGSHPAVDTYGEQFDRRAQRERTYAAFLRRHPARDPLTRARRCFGYLDELYSPTGEYDAIGFKLMYSHAKETPATLAYLFARRVHVIHLVRANLLDILVSDDTARARGRFHSSGDAIPQVTVSLDPGTVLARLRALDRQVRLARRLLAATRAPTVEVTYEGLRADPGGFAGILGFLGVHDPGGGLSSELQKLNRRRKDEIIDNYGAVERVLRDTRFAGFLDS